MHTPWSLLFPNPDIKDDDDSVNVVPGTVRTDTEYTRPPPSATVTDTDTPVHGHNVSDDRVTYTTLYDPRDASHTNDEQMSNPFTTADTHRMSNDDTGDGDTSMVMFNMSPATGPRPNPP